MIWTVIALLSTLPCHRNEMSNTVGLFGKEHYGNQIKMNHDIPKSVKLGIYFVIL